MISESRSNINRMVLCCTLACTPMIFACSGGNGYSDDDGAPPIIDDASNPDPNNSDNGETNDQGMSGEQPALPSVTGLRGVIYTDTEAEIFWNTPELTAENNADAIEQYEVWRDNQLIKTTDGKSHYDNDLTPATVYQYEVVSVNLLGQRSAVVSIELTTRAQYSTINEDNADQILSFVTDIVNEKYFEQHLENVSAVRDFDSRSADEAQAIGLQYESSSPRFENWFNHSFNCIDNAGTLITWRSPSIQDYTGAAEFSACRFNTTNPVVLSGESTYRWQLNKYVYNPGSNDSRTFNNYVSVDQNGQSQTLNFVLSENGSEMATRTVKNRRTFEGELIDERAFASTALEGTTFVESIELTRRSGKISDPDDTTPWSRELLANFSAQSPRSGNKLIRAETSVPFSTQADDSCFTAGALRISGDDGSWMEVNADTGDVNTFNLVVHTDGVTSTLQKSWTAENIFLQLLENASVTEPPSIVSSSCAGFYLDLPI